MLELELRELDAIDEFELTDELTAALLLLDGEPPPPPPQAANTTVSVVSHTILCSFMMNLFMLVVTLLFDYLYGIR